jgi:hypothetical protein
MTKLPHKICAGYAFPNFLKHPRRNILCIQAQPLAYARASACAFDRAATVRERLRTSAAIARPSESERGTGRTSRSETVGDKIQ